MKKILIVDDSETLRQIVHKTLEIFDFEIFEAEDTKGAMSLLEQHSMDLILLDWHLPDESGYDFFLKLQEIESFKEVPVIMITAEERVDKILQAIRSGVRHYLTKPFSHEDLLTRIVQVLELNQ